MILRGSSRCNACSAYFYSSQSVLGTHQSISQLTCSTCLGRQLEASKRKLQAHSAGYWKRNMPERLKFLCCDFENNQADDVRKGDVVIIVQGRAEEPLFAHKFILSSKSPVFRKMFNAKMLEEEKGVVNVDDAPRDVIRAVIKFCYDAEVNFTDDVTAECVLEVAHKYDIVLLQKICEEELIATITCDNLPKRLKMAMKFEARDLEEAAKQFFKSNFDDAISNVLAEMF